MHEHQDDESHFETNTDKQSQSLNVFSDKEGIENPAKSEFELKLDNYSSFNCISEQPSKSNFQTAQEKAQTKTSYYVRDEFQPLENHQTNIEKLLIQFKEQQQQFVDVIFQS